MCQTYTKQILIYSEINVYYYIFFNLETHEAYVKIFIKFFQILKDVKYFLIQFSHIHEDEKEIHTIIIDMCKKQNSDIICICKDYIIYMLIIYRI